jgi:hypothetical protein
MQKAMSELDSNGLIDCAEALTTGALFNQLKDVLLVLPDSKAQIMPLLSILFIHRDKALLATSLKPVSRNS